VWWSDCPLQLLLSGNMIKVLPDDIVYLTYAVIKWLYMQCICCLCVTPSVLSYLSSLSLSGNELMHLPSEIGKMCVCCGGTLAMLPSA
jgi:hypothetical protein